MNSTMRAPASDETAPNGRSSAPKELASRVDGLPLARLQQAHESVLSNLAAMDRITATRRPDPTSFTPVRLALSKASRERRIAFRQLCATLVDSGGPDAVLNRLLRDDAELAMRSHDHVRAWTLQAIQADWDGYRAASAEIRRAMRERLVRERLLLLAGNRPAREGRGAAPAPRPVGEIRSQRSGR